MAKAQMAAARYYFRRPYNALSTLLNVGVGVVSALVAWKSLMFILSCESPVVVVLSGSMEPAYYRGDVLALYRASSYVPGDIVVYNLLDKGIPIIHRVISSHMAEDGQQWYLTKGDNNNVDDRALYHPGQHWIDYDSINGKTFMSAPQAGMVTIWINEYPIFKAIMMVFIVMGLYWSKD
ncbi:MAG: uncharacterized protein KVP18_000708 [Porospora cf. gigantea A]|uniref:uncharacterized protein n=2 Tax=Porospora cf. gigantea A TaxID=2853593 RepID=UPI003559B7AD|nr:MAG: hypothetical protein KVP18_000708 [Porospora cf. gigantea A]